MDAFRLDVDQVKREFRKLHALTAPRARNFGELQKKHASGAHPNNYRSKNRYGDILPNEKHRVKLQGDGADGSDYINASYCRGDKKYSTTFVCTQCPLPQTFEDFWRMVWEQNIAVMVMVLRLTENGKVKGHVYWPTQVQQTIVWGDVQITLLKQCSIKQIEKRTFLVKHSKSNTEREVIHLHYLGWPDFGVPRETTSIRELLSLMNFYREAGKLRGQEGPVLVHCSAGVGRAGTFISIAIALDKLHDRQREEKTNAYTSRSFLNKSDSEICRNEVGGMYRKGSLRAASGASQASLSVSCDSWTTGADAKDITTPSRVNLLEIIEELDIPAVVLQLREQRNRGMVQTEDQYVFILRVIADAVLTAATPSRRPSSPSTGPCPRSPSRVDRLSATANSLYPTVRHTNRLDISLSISSSGLISNTREKPEPFSPQKKQPVQ